MKEPGDELGPSTDDPVIVRLDDLAADVAAMRVDLAEVLSNTGLLVAGAERLEDAIGDLIARVRQIKVPRFLQGIAAPFTGEPPP